MELTTELKNIIETAEKITSASPGLRNYDKANYEFLKEEWPKLKNKMENWEEIEFSDEDFEKTEFYEKFSTICQTNMRKIVKNCKIELDKIEKKEISNSEKQTKRNNLHDKFKMGGFIVSIFTIIFTIFGIIIAHIDNEASKNIELAYKQGKNEMTNILNTKEKMILDLSDSLIKYKLKIEELGKIIYKLKKTCK